MAKKAKSGRDRRRRERSRRRPTRATRSKVKNRTQKPRHAGKATIKREQRAYDDDPLAFVDTLMKRFGEAGGREAFLKFVAERPDRVGWDLFPSRRQSEWSRWPPLPQVPLEWW